MHLVVLGAFWPRRLVLTSLTLSVLMHLVVLGAFWRSSKWQTLLRPSLNAPCGAGCFLAILGFGLEQSVRKVLMHLVVLGAFWLGTWTLWAESMSRLNAPCGAGCFLATAVAKYEVLVTVLMHLVVLGAFWPLPLGGASLRHF